MLHVFCFAENAEKSDDRFVYDTIVGNCAGFDHCAVFDCYVCEELVSELLPCEERRLEKNEENA